MALIDSEGFGFSTNIADYITYGLFITPPPAGNLSGFAIQTGGIYGDNYMRGGGSYLPILRTLPVEVGSFFFGARTSPGGAAGEPSGYGFEDFGYVFTDASFNHQFSVRFHATGSISVVSDQVQTSPAYNFQGGTTVGASPPLSVLMSGWQYIEIGAVIHATAGSVVVKVNGVVVLSVSGVKTRGASSSATVRRYGMLAGGANQNIFGTAHWYFCDGTGAAPWNGFLGDVRVQSLFPTADDAVAFTPHGNGANWLNGGQVPPVPFTDYNSATDVGAQDTFEMGDIPATLGIVYGVHVKPLIFKSDAGERSGASVLKSGGSVDVGASTVLSMTAAQLRKVYEVDPATGVQWTVAGVNAIKAGYRVTA